MNIHKKLWNWCRRPIKPVSMTFARLATPLYISILVGGLLLAAYTAVVLFPPIMMFSRKSSVEACEWTDICHGAIVGISLATDGKWVTNNTYKITFLFSIQNLSGYANATTFYDNAYVVLNSVKLDPSYVNMVESPCKNLLEKQAWSVDWYFTPKADDFVLSCMGMSKGEQIQYSLFLEVNYTVVDSEGVEWPGLFQTLPPNPCLTVTIEGGGDAP
jgi:hypothetical protein